MPLMFTTGGLMKAVAKGDVLLVNKYLKSDKAAWIVARDKEGYTALHIAAQKGQDAIIRMLLDAGADVNGRDGYGATPLHNAVSNNRNSATALLLEAGAEVKGDGRQGSPLGTAVARNNSKATELLLKAKADPNEGTPLMSAAQYNHRDVALMLVEAGADINVHDNYYRYPIHFAASTGSLDLLKALLDKGADMDQRDGNNGYTPLHWAVIYGHNLVVEHLLEKGARTDIDSNDGKTPLELAYEKKNVDIIRKLEATAKPQDQNAAADAFAGNTGEDAEKWLRMGTGKVAHVGVYPSVGRKLTEIFNFTARERIIITENLKTGAENMSAPESFDNLNEHMLREALSAFRKLGGKADEARVLGGSGFKKKLSA